MADMPRVLVVEDEPADNQFLSMTVRGLGHAVESCFDGQAAIEWVQANKPSLVFLDALLPKADGFAVLREIRNLHPDVPVYMMSGVYKKKSYEQEAVGKLGATAYLPKPLGVLQVWEILERTLPPVAGNELSRDFPGVPFWRRPLPAVVADLHAQRKTGLLFVRGSGGSGILFIEDGTIVFGRCNDPQLRIDRVLTSQGKLRREQMPRVAEIAAQSRGRVGDALVAEKLITAEDLKEALGLQQRNHVTKPLTWTEGSCWFLASEAPRTESFKMHLDMPSLVFWACRHLQVDEHLIRFLPHPERKVRLKHRASDLAAAFGLSVDEVKMLELADGSRTVAQLRAIGRMMQLDVERMLAGLVSLDMLDLGSEPAAKPQLAPLFGSSVPVAGDLSRFPPAFLLVSMAFSRKTGTLQLEGMTDHGVVHRSVRFHDGDIAFANSSDPGDRLGQVLLRVGLLTRDQLQSALAQAQAQPNVPLGRILVAGGMLTPDDLVAALVHQAQQVVTGLVGWTQGTFRFQENDGPGRDVVPLGLDTRQALMTALRTCPFTDIAPRLPTPQTRLRATTTAHQLAADLPLTALEQRLRQEADGSRTVQEIAQSTPEGPEAALRAIFTMTTIGLVEGYLLTPGATPPPPRAAAGASAPAPSLPLSSEPVANPESTAERARRATVLALDESFESADDEPAAHESTLSATAEDWSGGDDASFAGLGDAPALEDWSAPEEASFSGLAEAAAAGFAFEESAGFAGLPLDAGMDWGAGDTASRTAVSAAAVAAPCLTAAQAEAVFDFLLRLAEWARTRPDAVPESLRARIPADLRQLVGL